MHLGTNNHFTNWVVDLFGKLKGLSENGELYLAPLKG